MTAASHDPIGPPPRGRFTPSTPRVAVPARACDCHVHVFGPYAHYPLAEGRTYSPPQAPREDLAAMLETLGLERVVLVQPSVYGTDNRCMLDALRYLGARARGVAVIGADTGDDELDELHNLGVRGVRVNAKTGACGDADAIAEQVARIAPRIAPLGWHLQLYLDMACLPGVATVLRDLPVAVVLDHFADIPRHPSSSAEAHAALVELLAAGCCWVKLSASYRFALSSEAMVTVVARQLAECRADRMLWGSDWPHTGGAEHGSPDAVTTQPFRSIDTGVLLDLSADWLPGDRLRHQVLVENPAALYGFDD